MIRTTGSAQKSSNIYAIFHPCAASIFLYFYKRSSLPLGLLLLFISVSVTRFGEIPPLWKIFKNLWKYIYGLFGFGPSFHDTLAQFVCFWANLFGYNGQKWKQNLVIWSHCVWQTESMHECVCVRERENVQCNLRFEVCSSQNIRWQYVFSWTYIITSTVPRPVTNLIKNLRSYFTSLEA